jgi:Prolyl oligopeptidase family
MTKRPRLIPLLLSVLMLSPVRLSSKASRTGVQRTVIQTAATSKPDPRHAHAQTIPGAEPSTNVFTESDSVSMRLISGPGANSNYGGTLNRDFAIFSPDGSKFVIAIKRGDISTNTVEYSLLLYRTTLAFASPKPVVLVSMSSSSNREAIKGVSWLRDNDTILFIGEHEGEHSQLYSIRCTKPILRRLTHHGTDLEAYSADARGETIAFIASTPVESVLDANTVRYGVHVSGEEMADLIRGDTKDEERELYILRNGVATRQAIPSALKGKLWDESADLSLSPDGRTLILKLNLVVVPDGWQQYRDRWVHRGATQYRPAGAPSWIFQYGVIDLKNGRARVLLDSPIGYSQSKIVWSPDSHFVVVTGLYLPLRSPSDAERLEPKTFVVEVALDSLNYLVVTDESLELRGWDLERPSTLVFCDDSSLKPARFPWRFVYFQKEAGGWRKIEAIRGMRGGIPEITTEEDLNTPPRIFALNTITGEKAVILDLNPQLRRLRLARVEDIRFEGAAGHEIRAGLYLPPDYEPGRHYPLVIQTHGFDPTSFWIDGPYPTAYAAQGLATLGICVLQLPSTHDWISTPEEGPKMVETFERAIAYIKSRGILDERRIGIVGFSRTGFHVQYALTHSALHFAAAVVADGSDGGYSQYIQFLNGSPYTATDSEATNGAMPFGPGIETWVKRSPEFSLDKVEAPLLIQALNPSSLSFQWATFVALRRLSKPVDLLYLPTGQHILQKPWDRLASQETVIDWFAFWLLGREDPDPQKAGEYATWRDLRRLSGRSVPN